VIKNGRLQTSDEVVAYPDEKDWLSSQNSPACVMGLRRKARDDLEAY
jgi:hypothetical protein